VSISCRYISRLLARQLPPAKSLLQTNDYAEQAGLLRDRLERADPWTTQ